jgi:restriction endonuclease Mrr
MVLYAIFTYLCVHFLGGRSHERYVSRIDSKIVLIGEEVLAQLMIDYNIGTAPIASYEIKRIDSGYFTEE